MTVKFDNHAKFAESQGNRNYYHWRLFVDEPQEKLKGIRSVEYVLHPTFPEPVQVRDNPGDRFALQSAGWGEFNVAIRVNYKDGRKEDCKYWLNLRKGWPD